MTLAGCSSGMPSAADGTEEVPGDPAADEAAQDPDMGEPDAAETPDPAEIIPEAGEEETGTPSALEICDPDNPGRIASCRNGSETCDDFMFTVPEGPIVLACHANPVVYQGDGIGYIAFNSGPSCPQEEGCCPPAAGADCAVSDRLFSDGFTRCRGWEQCGCPGQVCPCLDPWDQIQYASDGSGEIRIACTEEGTVRDIDLADHVGENLFGGVHTQPDRTTGAMSTACVAHKTW
jgi:hypothetical protein